MRKRAWPLTALWLILQPILFYWSVVVTATRHIPYDLESYHYPTLAYIAACIRRHELPLWDPYMYAGMPLHADLQAQMFYPPAWIAIAFGNLSAGKNLFYWVEWLIPLHMMLAGLFALLLLRRMGLAAPAALLGATVYQLGGFFASQACHLGAVCAGAWLPLAILAAYELRTAFRPRWFAALAGAMALTILSGYAATAIVTAGAVILFCFACVPWRAWWRVVAAFVLAALMCTLQLAPTMRLTSLSIASIRSQWLTAWGVPVESLVSLVSPNHYGIFDLSKYSLHFNFTLLYVYCGIAPLILLLLAPWRRRARVFAALTLVSAVWMLGEHTPVYPLVFGHLPPLIRGASYAWYAMMAFCLFAGISAALVLDSLRVRLPAAALWIVATVTSFDLLHAGRNRPMNTAEGGYAQSNSETRYGGSEENLRKLRAMVDVANPPLRLDYSDIWTPALIMGGMLQLPTTDGNIPFMQLRMYRLRRLFCATEPSAHDLAIAGPNSPIFSRNLPVKRPASPLLAMQNVGYVIGPGEIYRVPDPLPRFYLTLAVRASKDADETFRLLADPAFHPDRETIVEGLPGDLPQLGTGTVAVRRYTPDAIDLEVHSSAPGFLATSESWYPGWHATVNGGERRLLIANGVFRGLEVPAGESRITMTYRPAGFTASALISLAALILTIGVASLR